MNNVVFAAKSHFCHLPAEHFIASHLAVSVTIRMKNYTHSILFAFPPSPAKNKDSAGTKISFLFTSLHSTNHHHFITHKFICTFAPSIVKKFLVSILAILYMASAMGATLHIHYCMGKVADMTLSHKQDDRCRKCGMKNEETKKGCCKDEYKTLKTNDHKAAKVSFEGSSAVLFPVVTQNFKGEHQRYIAQKKQQSDYSIPFIRHCPIYVEVHNFRI